MSKNLKNILAICVGILPLNIVMIWYRLTHAEGFTTIDMLLYPLLFGVGNTLLILALNKYLLGEKAGVFSPGEGKWYLDILAGLGLTILFFLLVFVERATLSGILPQGAPLSREVINMMTDLARSPLLLAIWLGPVVWLGVALFEEISRVFFLNCLWGLSKKKAWEFSTILLVSATAGLMHIYQGAFGIISISIQGLVMGFYYYKFRRIWPLIISHALYDSFQIIMFVVQVQ